MPDVKIRYLHHNASTPMALKVVVVIITITTDLGDTILIILLDPYSVIRSRLLYSNLRKSLQHSLIG